MMDKMELLEDAEMKDCVFFSYSHKDRKKLSKIIEFLPDNIQLWHDETLKAGEECNDRIAHAIVNSSVLIFLSSKNSIHSKYCLQEVLLAVDKGVKVIIVHLDDFALPVGLEMRLGGYQSIYNKRFDPKLIANQLMDKIIK